MADFRTIEFNGRTFQSFGLFLKKDTEYIDFAELNVEIRNTEGAINGAELGSAKTEENIEKTYAFKTIPTKLPYDDEKKNLKVLIDFLTSSRDGFKILKDSARKGYFCYAFLKSIGSIKKSYDGCFEMSVTFSCKPYWYRERFETVEKEYTVVANENKYIDIYNPEVFTAYPYIKITGTATSSGSNDFVIRIFDQEHTAEHFSAFEILKIDGYIEIDSEKKNVFKGDEALNNYVNLLEYPIFPKLLPGNNRLQILFRKAGTFGIEIVPRWRCL